MIHLFVYSLLVPASFDLGGLNLSTSRIFVLVLFLPFFLRFLSGGAGQKTSVDFFLMFHGMWMVVALLANHGVDRFAYGSMLFVEMFGGYLTGRLLISSVSTYKKLFSILLAVLFVLLPFALFELVTDRAIMQDISRALLGSSHGDVAHDPRMGLYRVQSVMQHPILFGVFCSFVVANAFFIWRENLWSAIIRSGLALVATFMSLSSGALLACMVQILLVVWGRVTGNAWKQVALISLCLYVFLTFASNRGPVVLIIETLTFNSGTGWTRIHIWRNGIDDALANPIFGIGLNDWTRPFWLADSVDNFWLLTSMRFGFVGVSFLVLGLALHIKKIVAAKGLSEREKQIRTGYMIGLVSLILSLATVHIWGPPYVLLMAYIGAGAWFYAPRKDRSSSLDFAAENPSCDSEKSRANVRKNHQ